MAGKTFKLSIVVDATTKSATKALGGLGKTLGGVATAAGVVGTAVVGGAALAGGALLKLAVDAAPMEGVKDAFYGIAEASGKSGDAMLAALQKGSAGMITQRDLMMKYNLAAQLVGDTFANELPNAMGYLGKVSAATGEDMGYMLDSLVRGVGRLSPMILDNLGIQVDLSEAYEAFAPTIGKTVGELTKQEQQTALMNQVMEKLAENTAAMPEVMGSAAQGVASLGVQIKDLKDGIGLALQPVLVALLTPLNDLAQKYGPQVIKWAEKAGTWLGENLPRAIDTLKHLWVTYWPQARDLLVNFWNAIQPALEWLRDMFRSFSENYLPRLREAWDILRVGWDEIVGVFNSELKPALQELWNALQPLWETLGIGEAASLDVGAAIGKFTGFLVKLHASGVIEAIKLAVKLLAVNFEILLAVFRAGKAVGEAVANVFIRLRDASQGIRDRVIQIRDVFNSMTGALNNVRHWIAVIIEKFNHLKSCLGNFQLPSWLQFHSPTELEQGLVGIAKALANVQNLARGGIGFDSGMALAGAGAGAGGGGGGITTVNIVNRFGPDSVRSDQDILDIADAIAKSLELRGAGRVL